MSFTYLDRSADAATVADILRRDGAVAVTELVERCCQLNEGRSQLNV